MIHFAHVIPRLPASDLSRTIAFYRDLLGFDEDVSWPDDVPTFVILRRDYTSVGFFTPSEHQPGPPGYAELYIEVSNATALHEDLSSRVSVEWGPEVFAYGRREFAVRDPNGYLIIFTEPTNDPPTTNEP